MTGGSFHAIAAILDRYQVRLHYHASRPGPRRYAVFSQGAQITDPVPHAQAQAQARALAAAADIEAALIAATPH